jgi:anthranilate/para-aminobenzoate synthase component I
MSQMFLEYDKAVYDALVAGATVSGVAGASTQISFRWDGNSTTAYPIAGTSDGGRIQQIFYRKETNQIYILFQVTS